MINLSEEEQKIIHLVSLLLHVAEDDLARLYEDKNRRIVIQAEKEVRKVKPLIIGNLEKLERHGFFTRQKHSHAINELIQLLDIEHVRLSKRWLNRVHSDFEDLVRVMDELRDQSRIKIHSIPEYYDTLKRKLGNIRDTRSNFIKRLDLASRLLHAINPHKRIVVGFAPVIQEGLQCVVTSLVNGLHYLGEPFLSRRMGIDVGNAQILIRHFYQNTERIRTNEMRNFRQVGEYINSGQYRNVGVRELYGFITPVDILDIVYALAYQKAVVLVARGVHAELAFGIYEKDNTIIIQMKDPMREGEKEIKLAEFETSYPYKGILLPKKIRIKQ